MTAARATATPRTSAASRGDAGAGARTLAVDVTGPECRVELPAAGFEGPLDLLLHLIQTHELDILDIPVAFVTERYLAYLRLMEALTIDLASEYLVMAATLVHIKSKMLLPAVPEDQDGDALLGENEEDPRAELVRRLLEYQKYKAAAAQLEGRGTLGRDVFPRGAREPAPVGPAPFAPPPLFALLDALEGVLKRTKVKIDHEVVFDRIGITDRIMELTERLRGRRTARFEELFEGAGGALPSRFEVIITFLAVLEMCKMRLLRVFQSEPLAPIHLELQLAEGEEGDGEEGVNGGASATETATAPATATETATATATETATAPATATATETETATATATATATETATAPATATATATATAPATATAAATADGEVVTEGSAGASISASVSASENASMAGPGEDGDGSADV